MNCNVTITGSKGFLGNYLANYFNSQIGYKVFKLTSSFEKNNENYYYIGEEINKEILKKTNILILCAHDFTNQDVNFQLNGFEIIKNQINNLSLNIKVIYISSIAAFKEAKSLYGKSKYLTEKSVIKNSGLVIKPGIIYGNKNIKGLINKISNFTLRYGFAPNFLNLKSKIFLTHIDDLSYVIKKIALNENEGVYLCANINPKTFKELILRFSQNDKIILIPLFWQFLYVGIKILEVCKFNTGFRSDSILSLAKQNRKPKEGILLKYTKYFRD